jgi:type I restriction-modification system DNA methylase subunit
LGSEINQRKKDLGAFYTPSHLAESITSNAIESYLLQNLNVIYQNNFKSLNKIWKNGNPKLIRHIDKISKSLRVLDGSAGNGEFLISAFNKIKEIRERVSYILDKNSTRSIDIELEILNFNIFGMEIDPETLSLEGNYLESDSSNWENFPRKKKGFDIILGNPPWGGKLTKAQKDHYHDRFSIKSPKRNLNTKI